MATPWVVPRFWEGKTVVVLASGRSMSQAVADEARERWPVVIAVNDTFALAPEADMLYAADSAWWMNKPKALAFKGLKVTGDQNTPYPEVLLLERTGNEGFDPDPGRIRTGGNSGYQAVHVAIHAGASKILLAGFDMRGNGHFFGWHQPPLRNTATIAYEFWKERFNALKDRGAEILNCSPESALHCFPFGNLSDGRQID